MGEQPCPCPRIVTGFEIVRVVIDETQKTITPLFPLVEKALLLYLLLDKAWG